MKQTCDTIFTAAFVVTQNEARTVIPHGAVAVSGNRISAIGPASDIAAAWDAGETVSLGNAAIMPGLVNGHTHIPMSALRGYSDDKNLMDWLTKDIFPIETHLTPEIIRTASEFSCAEMMRTGTTAFYDMYMHERSVFQAADRMGMRAVMGESMTHFFPGLSAASEQELRDLILALAEEWKGHPRIKGAIVPHAVYTTDPDFLQRCRALADDLGWQFGMHLSETAGETEKCLKQHGKRPVEYCRSLGLLRPDTTLFHMVDTDGEDLDTIAETGCAIVHNPASNMKLTSGAAPIGAMLARGIPVGLGTDGPASNNSQNMVREMYLCSLLQKLATMDPTALPAQTTLDMATRGSARALHWEGLGTLEPGSIADFVAIGLDEPNMQPVHNIVSNIVYAATGLENRLTVVDGRILYRDGRYLACDYEALKNEMASIRQWIAAKAS